MGKANLMLENCSHLSPPEVADDGRNALQVKGNIISHLDEAWQSKGFQFWVGS